MRVPSIITVADVSTRWIKARLRTRAVFDRGGRDMTAGSTGSTPRDWAGGPSIRISKPWSGSFFMCKLAVQSLTNPQDLHRVQRVTESEKGAEEDERKSSHASAELKGDKVLDVIKDALSLFNGAQYG